MKPLAFSALVLCSWMMLSAFAWVGQNVGAQSGSVQLYYLGSFAQTTGFSLTTTSHGPLGVACRTGWRVIQPTSSTTDWSSLDACQAAAAAAGTKWSLSVKAGADVPLWLFNSSCTATPQSGETGPGGGSLNAETFTWNQSFEYTNGSTQCLPVPWESNYQTDWNNFIQLIAARYATDPTLDHVVVTGINSITQENLQPFTSGDLTEWANYLAADGQTCTSPPTTCPQYATAITNAYTTFIADWGNAFPANVGLASMYVDQNSFPFQSNNGFAKSLMTLLSNFSQSRSLPMNNAAAMNGTGNAFFDAAILSLWSPAQRVAFQEGTAVGCPNAITLVNGASAEHLSELEIYPADFSCL